MTVSSLYDHYLCVFVHVTLITHTHMPVLQVFEINPICPVQGVRPDYSDRAISHVCELAKKRTDNKGLDLLIAILDDSNGSLYGKLPVLMHDLNPIAAVLLHDLSSVK